MFKLAYSTMSREQGFTLIELIFVIIMLAVLATSLMLRNPVPTLKVVYESRRILNDMRYAQLLSMTTGQRYRFVITGSNTYQIQNEAGTAIVLPTGGSSVILASGVSFGAISNLPSSFIVFDSQGIPYTDSSLPGTALAGVASIGINAIGVTHTLTVQPTTGFGSLS